jgi:hypothetical protein
VALRARGIEAVGIGRDIAEEVLGVGGVTTL